MYIVRKSIELDAAHRVADHNSQCSNLHGHRWKVTAELDARKLIDGGSETGMVRDFGIIKEVMMREIHTPCDHAFIYCRDDVHAKRIFENDTLGFKYVVLDKTPTAENLAEYWFNKLAGVFGKALVAVGVNETPSSYAEFRP